jgi:hypothetical protein
MIAVEQPVCLVHLAWAPLGPEPLRRFMASYREHPAGCEHRLLVLMKGFSAAVDRGPWRETLSAVAHEELDAPSGTLDLGTYRWVIESAGDAGRFCFTNSNSIVQCDDWLGMLDRALCEEGVGIVGAAGSHESAYSAAPFWLKRRRRRDFPPFPNIHLRSNGFALARELARSLDWPPPVSKLDAWRLESGNRSITRQVLERGLQALVVGRDGVGYPPDRWAASATFRSGGQRNLLLADNRTRQWEESRPARKQQFTLMTWGTAEAPAA